MQIRSLHQICGIISSSEMIPDHPPWAEMAAKKSDQIDNMN
jgi:hypothetical protein